MNIRRKDIFTAANALSLTGLILVVYGSINLTSLIGVFIMGTGRVLDLLDGHVARRTHSSPFGAAVDAVFDKIALATIVLACAWYSLVFWPLLAWVAVQNSANAVLASIAKAKGSEILPVIQGKYTMFLQNLSIGLLLVANFVDITLLHQLLTVGGLICGIASVPFGLLATRIYALHVGAQLKRY